jgi:2-dehydro-3-deoxyphosphogluconate aldolase / (4S)-4-hydroxy-2-oxoglutarate aldolase
MEQMTPRHCAFAGSPALALRKAQATWIRLEDKSSGNHCCSKRITWNWLTKATACGSVARQLDRAVALLRASRLVLCVRLGDPDTAFAACDAALRGGIQCVEVTMTVPNAAGVIAELLRCWPDAHIGAGTVLTLRDADVALQAGALFAMSPVMDSAVVQYCNESGLLAVPGAATPNEVWAAARPPDGARLVKLYPAEIAGGLKLVRALQGPLGQVPLLPTSGIALGAVSAYLAAPNVCAIGVSTQILSPDAVSRRDWALVTDLARKWTAVAHEHCPSLNNKSDADGRMLR